MTIEIGDRLPDAALTVMGEEGPETLMTQSLGEGRRLVIFGLPGAFTPTCSALHLPGFLAQADALRTKGVDAIVCVSVNDVYVMDAWGKQQGVAGRVMMAADGNGDFTRAVGLDVDMTDRGFGLRSRRYAMVVEDGVVTLLNVEEPGEFKVSDAQTVLASL